MSEELNNTQEHIRFVGAECQDQRLDAFLAQEFPLYSRTWLQALISQGQVVMPGVAALKSSYRLKAGDQVTIKIPVQTAAPIPSFIPETLGIKLIYAHEHFLVISKPAGIMVHRPTTFSQAITVTQWLTTTFTEVAHVGNAQRPGIVHRLDQDTSGLLLIARTSIGHTILADLFKQRAIHKTYLALVHGHPSPEGTTDLAIGRHQAHRHKMAAFKAHELGTNRTKVRQAQTNYKVITYFDEYSLVAAMPVTGRTHQIRVHMAAIGHPIVGDQLYSTKKTNVIKRHALHAHKITFAFMGEQLSFEDPVPEDFQLALAQMKNWK